MKHLFLKVGDEVIHKGYSEWGTGTVVEEATSTLPGGICLVRIKFEDGSLRVFNNDLDSEICCYNFGIRKFWKPSKNISEKSKKTYEKKEVIKKLSEKHS